MFTEDKLFVLFGPQSAVFVRLCVRSSLGLSEWLLRVQPTKLKGERTLKKPKYASRESGQRLSGLEVLNIRLCCERHGPCLISKRRELAREIWSPRRLLPQFISNSGPSVSEHALLMFAFHTAGPRQQ